MAQPAFDPKAYLASFEAPGGSSPAPEAQQDNGEYQGQGLGSLIGAGVTTLNKAVDTGTFGVSTDLAGVLTAAIGKAMGRNISVADGIRAARKTLADESEAHPYASMLGTGVGMVAGGAGLVKGAEMVGAKALTTFTKGEGLAGVVTNAGKAGVLGAAGGAVQGAGDSADKLAEGKVGEVVHDVMGGAEAGAVGGAVLGGAAAAVTRLARPLVYKAAATADGVTDRITQSAWKIVGSKLALTGDEIQQLANNVMAQRGTPPTIAEMLTWNKQGVLRQMASKDGGVAQTFNDMAKTTGGQLQSDMQYGIKKAAGGNLDSVDSLTNARDTKMDSAMVQVGSDKVNLSKAHSDILGDNAINKNVSSDISERMSQALADIEGGGSSQRLTVSDIDAIRQSASKIASRQYAAGNSTIGMDYQGMADKIRGAAKSSSPGYSAALEEFSKDSARINGFESGLGGKDPVNISNDRIRADTLSPHGQEGYKAGMLARLHAKAGAGEDSAMSVAADLAQNKNVRGILQAHPELLQLGEQSVQRAENVNSINRPYNPEDNTHGVMTGVAHTVGALVSHSFAGGAYQGLRAGAAAKLQASPQVLAKAAQLLTDPTQTQQGLNILRRAGASEAQIRRILHTAGAAYGGAAFSGYGQ